ncbi:unnamed protein product, partial [Closterium sp. NIES-54]
MVSPHLQGHMVLVSPRTFLLLFPISLTPALIPPTNQVQEDCPGKLSAWYRHISRGAWPFSTRDHGWPISDCSSEGLKASLILEAFPPHLVGEAIPERRLCDCVDVILSYQPPLLPRPPVSPSLPSPLSTPLLSPPPHLPLLPFHFSLPPLTFPISLFCLPPSSLFPLAEQGRHHSGMTVCVPHPHLAIPAAISSLDHHSFKTHISPLPSPAPPSPLPPQPASLPLHPNRTRMGAWPRMRTHAPTPGLSTPFFPSLVRLTSSTCPALVSLPHHPMQILNPSETFGNIIIDYSYVECTSASIQALTAFTRVHPDYRADDIEQAIWKARGFLVDIQRDDGSWYGSWGVCFTYGTWFGISGLVAAGARYETSNAVRKAVRFLLDKQLPAGGWGESYLSSQDKVCVRCCASTYKCVPG